MQAEARKDVGFEPVILTIKLESQEELDRFTRLFNHVAIDSYLRCGLRIVEVLREHGGNSSPVKDLTEVLERWANGRK